MINFNIRLEIMRIKMKTKEIKTLINLLNTNDLSELSYQEESFSLTIKREVIENINYTKKNNVIIEEKEDDAFHIVSSPIVGTFYRTPSPDSPPYVEVGSTVKKGDVLCTIEAMKIMNQLEAEYDCEIIEIYPEQASLVEFDQKLFKVRPL